MQVMRTHPRTHPRTHELTHARTMQGQMAGLRDTNQSLKQVNSDSLNHAHAMCMRKHERMQACSHARMCARTHTHTYARTHRHQENENLKKQIELAVKRGQVPCTRTNVRTHAHTHARRRRSVSLRTSLSHRTRNYSRSRPYFGFCCSVVHCALCIVPRHGDGRVAMGLTGLMASIAFWRPSPAPRIA